MARNCLVSPPGTLAVEPEGHEDEREDHPHAKEGQWKANFYSNEANGEASREPHYEHRCGDGGQHQGERQGPAGCLRPGQLGPVGTDELVQVCVGIRGVAGLSLAQHHPALLRPHQGNGRERTTGESGPLVIFHGAGTPRM